MADCKHEIDIDNDLICAKCDMQFYVDEIIILDKAQHDKMNAVVEAGKEVNKYFFTTADGTLRISGREHKKQTIIDLEAALTALEGE